jgi:hypothetical protein
VRCPVCQSSRVALAGGEGLCLDCRASWPLPPWWAGPLLLLAAAAALGAFAVLAAMLR